MRRERNCSTTFLERTPSITPTLELGFKGNLTETYERRDGAHMGFSELIKNILT